MRHVPNRKLYKLTRKPIWKLAKCYEMKYWNSLEDSLDPSFKWHRETANHVEFDFTDGNLKGTVLLPVKWGEYSK